jgi:Tol biopolymer transport system component
MSADGRFVAFLSFASNLVPADTNGSDDIFVRDGTTHTTTRVSVSSTGAQGSNASAQPSISADGRFVAFRSFASNLVPGDTNGVLDLFVRDRTTHTTTRISVSSTGAQGNGNSFDPSMSADGRFVAFDSDASNLVLNDTNFADDVFVRDRTTHTTRRVSVSSTGAQGNDGSSDPSISADGRFVAFRSSASNLVPGDTNGVLDLFVRDRTTHTTTRISVSSTGAQGNENSYDPSISGDGRFVAFFSFASNLMPADTNGVPDIFVRDRTTHATTRVSLSSSGAQGDDLSLEPSISADGRFVAFDSSASNLVPGDTNGVQDVFVRDRVTHTTTRVSASSSGAQGDDSSFVPSISADGRFVAFDSSASNLVAGDTNAQPDMFVRGPLL